MTSIINLLILISISFSIAHGVVLNPHKDNNHCSIKEFVVEFSKPINHNKDENNKDLCDSHFMLHISFILPINFSLNFIQIVKNIPKSNPLIYNYLYLDNNFRPPII